MVPLSSGGELSLELLVTGSFVSEDRLGSVVVVPRLVDMTAVVVTSDVVCSSDVASVYAVAVSVCI